MRPAPRTPGPSGRREPAGRRSDSTPPPTPLLAPGARTAYERGGVKNGDDTGTTGRALQLIRETVDGLGHLIAQHVKLARLELSADLRALGARAAGLVALAVLLVVGYTLALTGVALLIGGARALALPFLGIGGAHVVVAALGAWAVTRARRARPLAATKAELDQTADALAAALRAPSAGGPPAAAARQPAAAKEATDVR